MSWLLKGSALARFLNLKECFLKYLEENNEQPTEYTIVLLLKNEDRLQDYLLQDQYYDAFKLFKIKIKQKILYFSYSTSLYIFFCFKQTFAFLPQFGEKTD